MSSRQRGPVEFQLFSERKHGPPTASKATIAKCKVRPIGRVNGLWNWFVKEECVRNLCDVDFCMGSHDGHSSFIPIGEVWVGHRMTHTDLAPLLVHEAVEREWMVKRGWSYERAHDRASMFEVALRKKIQKGLVKVHSVADAVKIADLMSRHILHNEHNGRKPPEKKAAASPFRSPREIAGDVDPLAAYLAPAGKAPGIGAERSRTLANGIVRLVSPHGSVRYLAFTHGEAVSVLQVVTRDGKHATIANVYTLPAYRQKGYAARLLAQARRDFRTVAHASEANISEMGKAWRAKVGSPIRPIRLNRAQRTFILRHERFFYPETLLFGQDKTTYQTLLRRGLVKNEMHGRTKGFTVTRMGRDAAHPFGM